MACRIYSAAKEFKVDSKELVDICARIGIRGKGSALASLSEEEYSQLAEHLKRPVAGARQPTAHALPTGTVPEWKAVVVALPRRLGPLAHAASLRQAVPTLSAAISPIINTDPFLLELYEDVRQARNGVDTADCPFFRRTYVRTFFSAAEAIIATVSSSIVENLARGKVRFEGDGFAKIALKTQCRNPTQPHTIEFVISTYAKLRRRDVSYFMLAGWDAFQEARKIRNLLTHPDKEVGIEVSNESLQIIRDADQWFFDFMDYLEADETSGVESSEEVAKRPR